MPKEGIIFTSYLEILSRKAKWEIKGCASKRPSVIPSGAGTASQNENQKRKRKGIAGHLEYCRYKYYKQP